MTSIFPTPSLSHPGPLPRPGEGSCLSLLPQLLPSQGPWEGAHTHLGVRSLRCGNKPPVPAGTLSITCRPSSWKRQPKASYKGGHARRPHKFNQCRLFTIRNVRGWTRTCTPPQLALRFCGWRGKSSWPAHEKPLPLGPSGFWGADPLACSGLHGTEPAVQYHFPQQLTSACFEEEREEEASLPQG